MVHPFGPYQMQEELGRGGMAAVYRALDTRTGRTVALKVLRRPLTPGSKEQGRFRREVTALRRLRHPGVVQVLEAGEHQGRGFLALEYLEGGTLEERIKREGQLSSGEAAELGRALAKALHAAHMEQIVHRDLKPANVLFDKSGKAKLADFGLARSIEVEASRLTQSGVFLGTPGYMAPEQVRGSWEEIGPGADVYGLGATLFACLAGVAPVEGDTVADVLIKTEEGRTRSLRELGVEVERGLVRVVERCLEREVGDRYTSAAAVEEALEGCLGGEEVKDRRWVWGVVGVGLAVGLGAVLGLGEDAPAVVELEEPEFAEEGAEEVARASAEELESINRAQEWGDTDQAVERGRVLAAQYPEDPAVWDLLGWVLLEQGEVEEAEAALRRVLALGGVFRDTHHNLAWVCAQSGQFAEALEHAERAVELAPENVSGRRMRGEVLLAWWLEDPERSRYERACEDFEVALREGEGDRRALLVKMMQVCLQAEEWEETVRWGERVLALQARDVNASYCTGRALLELGRHTEALERLGWVAPQVPSSETVWVAYARALGAVGRWEEAAAAYDRVVRLGVEEPDVRVDHGLALLEAEDARGRSVLEAWLPRAEGRAEAWARLGAAQVQAGALGEAEVSYTRSLEIAPSFEAYAGRGVVRRSMGRPESALPDLSEALALRPDHVDVRRERLLARMRSDQAGALEDCERLLELRPGDTVARGIRGSLLRGQGDFARAIEDFTWLIEHSVQDSHQCRAYFDRGSCRLARQEFALAASDFDASLALDPSSYEAWLSLGRARMGSLEHAEAREALDRAIALRPDLRRGYVLRCLVALAEGRHEEAFADFQRAERLPADGDEQRFEGLRRLFSDDSGR